MSDPHALTGLFAGDYFIHRFDFDGEAVFAYGFLRSIDPEGRYYADYQSAAPPSRPSTLSKDSHYVVGRISRRAYLLAQLRSWPNTEPEVADIIHYSAGKTIALTFRERIRLFLVS